MACLTKCRQYNETPGFSEISLANHMNILCGPL